MNRYLLAKKMRYMDELSWNVRRKDGSTWKCLWRNLDDSITFLAMDVDADKVKIVFTLQLPLKPLTSENKLEDILL